MSISIDGEAFKWSFKMFEGRKSEFMVPTGKIIRPDVGKRLFDVIFTQTIHTGVCGESAET